MSVTNLELTGGTIGGSGQLELLGQNNWHSGQLDTGTLPSGATLLVETAGWLYMRHDRQRGTLDVTGGELALVGNNSFIAMTGSARLVNSGTVNFTHRWRHRRGLLGGD